MIAVNISSIFYNQNLLNLYMNDKTIWQGHSCVFLVVVIRNFCIDRMLKRNCIHKTYIETALHNSSYIHKEMRKSKGYTSHGGSFAAKILHFNIAWVSTKPEIVLSVPIDSLLDIRSFQNISSYKIIEIIRLK